jgi:WD40 repeat protein
VSARPRIPFLVLSLASFSFAPLAWTAEPPITAAAFAPDGKSVVIGSQAGVEVRSWPELKPVRKLDTKLVHVHDLIFSPKGDLLAIAGGKPAEQGAVEFVRWSGGDGVSHDVLHEDLIHAFAWRGDGRQWVTASADRTCRLHDATGKVLHTFDGHSGPVLAIAFAPDGKLITSAGMDQTIRVWDAATGQQVRSFENHVAAVHALAFRPGQDSETPPCSPRRAPTVPSDSGSRPSAGWSAARLPSRPLSLAWSNDGARLLAGCATAGSVSSIPTR